MSNYAEQFAMSKYASSADRSAAMLAELKHLALDLHTERAAVVALRSQMERQKDEWLAWAEKRSALERDAERVKVLEDALTTAMKWGDALSSREYARCRAALEKTNG